MGMFDFLRCHVELPGLSVRPDIEFQTKFYFRVFARLVISADGRLYNHQPDGGDEDARIRELSLANHDLEYHGDLRFYTSLSDGVFYDFVARFSEGNLTWIKPLSDLSEQSRDLLNCGLE